MQSEEVKIQDPTPLGSQDTRPDPTAEPVRIEFITARRGLVKLMLAIYLGALGALLAINTAYYLTDNITATIAVLDLLLFNVVALVFAVAAYKWMTGSWLKAYSTQSTLHSITEISSDAVFTVLTDSTVSEWSKGAEAIFGYAADEILGQSVALILSDSFFDTGLAAIADLVERGVVTNRRSVYKRKSGEDFPTEASATLLRTPAGDPSSVLLVLRDITERVVMEEKLRRASDELEQRVEDRTGELRRANEMLEREVAERARAERELEHAHAELEQAHGELELTHDELEQAHADLKREKEFIERAVNTMEDIFVVFALDGKILHWNRKAEVVTARGDDLANASVFDFLDPVDTARAGKSIELGLKVGKARLRADLLTVDGNRLPYEFFGTPFKDVDGEYVGAIVIGRDVSERERIAQIEKNTAAVIAAAEVARENSEELKHLIEIAAHELRHPATVLKGFAYILLEQRDNLTGERAEYALKAINRGADRLVTIVNTLFETTLVERDMLTIAPRHFLPASLVHSAVEEMIARGEGAFDTSRVEQGVSVEADQAKLKLVLSELIENAVKYSPPDEPIEVWCSYTDGHAVFSVADRGPGVPPESRDQIFDRFHQVEDAFHHSLPGLGLGLYLAERIVDAHGGWIAVDDNGDRGALFSFGIPLD